MTRKATPAQIAARKLFAERAKAGTLRKRPRKAAKKVARKNPSTAKRRGPSKVNAPSQLTGKKPSARLKSRRLKNTKPRVYPNPSTSIKKNFCVWITDKQGKPLRKLAEFYSYALAVEYSRAYTSKTNLPTGVSAK